MKKIHYALTIGTAALLYVVNPYTGLSRFQELMLMVLYLICGFLFSLAVGILAGQTIENRKKRKFRRWIRMTTL